MAQGPATSTEQHRPKHRPKRTGRGRGGRAAQAAAQGQRAKQSTQQRWWAALPEAEADPISLEPLRLLRYPPFECRADLSLSPVHKAAAGLVHAQRGISLRFPRFLRERPDKSVRDAATFAEVAERYRAQSNVSK